jgi:DEAD/DEAH box helicase domain-containing protein
LAATRRLIAECPCENGCPGCVGPIGNTGPLAKLAALRILDLLLAAAEDATDIEVRTETRGSGEVVPF